MRKQTIHIIGAGGVGYWLAPLVHLTNRNKRNVVVWDADKIEEKNLDRLLLPESTIGTPKAQLLAGSIGAQHVLMYIHPTIDFDAIGVSMDKGDFIICAADNHRARKTTLELCDIYGCRAVICGNETFTADGYYYEPSMRGTKQDPRIQWPEILTSRVDDPIERTGCTGTEVRDKNPQLPLANFMAAAFAGHLFQYHIDREGPCNEFDPTYHYSNSVAFATMMKTERENQ